MNEPTTLPAMPRIACPAWCTEDHVLDWAQHVAVLATAWTIPRADGTLVYHEPVTDPAVIVERWIAVHSRTLVDLELDSTTQYAAAYISSDVRDERPTLGVEVRGEMTREQALTFATALRDTVLDHWEVLA